MRIDQHGARRVLWLSKTKKPPCKAVLSKVLGATTPFTWVTGSRHDRATEYPTSLAALGPINQAPSADSVAVAYTLAL